MKKQHIIGGIIVVIAIVAVIIGMYPKKSAAPVVIEKDGMKTYIETDAGFTVTFPSTWIFEDRLTADTCCLFIAHWTTSTTTEPNASGTPVTTVTKQESIKLQIGAYDRRVQDPFSTTTRQTTLNGKTIYTGYAETGQYFLFPKDTNTGVGVAEFRYKETPQADIDEVQKIVSSIVLTATSTKK